MGRISSSVVVRAPMEEVYALAHEIEKFPAYMSSLKKIELLDRSDCGCKVKARWHAEAKLILTRRQMCWVQIDEWNDEERMCCSTVDPCECGHYRKLDARWSFKPHPRGTEMEMDVDFEIDHPLITPAIHKVIDAIMERNNRAMLESIKKKAETAR